MSALYLATGQALLAERLAVLLDRQVREADAFVPAQIVVPNRYLGSWLRFWLARRHGIAVNLRFRFLEAVLWDMLRSVDPRVHQSPPELLDENTYRLLVLAVLLAEGDVELASLQRYFGASGSRRTDWQSVLRGNDAPSRRSWRRVWHLADRLGKLIRDYEY